MKRINEILPEVMADIDEHTIDEKGITTHSTDLEDEIKRLREEVVRCHTLDDERRRVIRELRSQIATR